VGADTTLIGGATSADGRSLTQRASFTAVASLIDYATKIGVALVVTPILVGGLGRSLYGVWEILIRLVAYMSATDGRPASALRLIVARDQGVADPAVQRRHVGSALAVWSIFVPIVVVAGGMLTWFAPMITKVGPESYASVRVACALLVASFVAMNLAAVPESALRGMNLGYRQMGLQSAVTIAGGLLMAGAVATGLGLAGLAAAQVALAVLTGLTFLLLARRHVRWFGAERPLPGEVRGMLGVSAWLAVGDLVTKLLLASDVIILGMVLAPGAVTTYTLTGYAAKTGVGILSFTVGAAMPGLGGLIGRAERDRAAALRSEILDLIWVLVVAVGATILVWNEGFVRLWVGPVNYAGPLVNLLIVLIAAQTAFIRTDAYILDAALRPRARVAVSAAAAATTIVLAVIGVRLLGLPGLCLGVIGGRAIQSVVFPILVRRCLTSAGEPPSPRSTWRPARPAAAAIVILGTATVLGERVAPATWPAWSIGMATSFVIFLAITYRLGLPAARRAALRERFAVIRGAVR
jgi:O-antigen/teichoic acid export membrane protein